MLLRAKNMVSGNIEIERELEHILKNVAIAKSIKNYEVIVNINVSKGDGLLSEFFTGEVVNKDNGKETHVGIKRAPNDTTVLSVGFEPMYRNELHFYSQLFPELDRFQRKKGVKDPFNYIPTYLTGKVDSKSMYIAMENLKDEGYVLYDKKKCFNKEHLEFIFKVYGKFHSLSFNFQKENMNGYKRLVEPIADKVAIILTDDSMVKNLKMAYLKTLETFDPITEADLLEKLRKVENVKEVILDVLAYNGNYKCLIHGDGWSNNMLFKYKDSGELQDVKLIDFQVLRSSTPVHDLSYFFYSAALKEDLDNLDYFLGIYYESFSNFTRELGGNPEEIFPLAVLKEEWRKYGIFGMLMGCMVWSGKLLDKEKIIELLNEKDIPVEKFWDLFAEKAAEVYENVVYKEMTKNICLHAIEYGLNF